MITFQFVNCQKQNRQIGSNYQMWLKEVGRVRSSLRLEGGEAGSKGILLGWTPGFRTSVRCPWSSDVRCQVKDFRYCLVLSPISHTMTCTERREVRVTVQETPYTLIHQTYLRDHPSIGFIQSSLHCLTATWLFPWHNEQLYFIVSCDGCSEVMAGMCKVEKRSCSEASRASRYVCWSLFHREGCRAGSVRLSPGPFGTCQLRSRTTNLTKSALGFVITNEAAHIQVWPLTSDWIVFCHKSIFKRLKTITS